MNAGSKHSFAEAVVRYISKVPVLLVRLRTEDAGQARSVSQNR